jgi:DMSO/TMAO reductase YedYZ molybdopterin-dependent catalytic subunit
MRAAAFGGLALTDPDAWLARLDAQPACAEGPWGDLVRVLPLTGAGARDTPLGEMVGGAGLDARLFTDLSTLTTDALVTPAANVYVRTSAPRGLTPDRGTWQIALGAAAGPAGPGLGAAALAAAAQPMGAHVMECAGNSNPQNFGLMSAVEWDGVLLSGVLSRLPRPDGATGVLVTGLDDATSGSGTSQPGASWVLPLEAINQSAPFLAVRMNGQPLTADHGAPVRLVVPGWYGCAWIKWVTRIEWVGGDAPATSQMREFAGRTHQDGMPALARDYEAPAIDTAAMPVRIEQRRVDGRLEYRVVGIVWGGTQPVDRLVIRFGPRDPGTPFAICPAPPTHHTWALWTYRWRPAEPRYFDIALRAADPTVRTRRLDLSFYVRRVRIDEI